MARRDEDEQYLREEAAAAMAALQERYNRLSDPELKDAVVRLLNEIEDLTEQRKAHMDSFRDLIKDKKEEVKYCRELISTVNRQTRTDEVTVAADELLEA